MATARRRTVAALLSAALLTAPLPGAAHAAPVAEQRPAAAVSARPPADPPIRKLDRLADRLRRAGAVAVTAQVSKGRRTWAWAWGNANRDPRKPARPAARFRAGSVTKMVTSVLALQLVDRGRWSLGTTIGDVLPGLWPGREDVTLRQLLSHTSGMPDVVGALVREAQTNEEFLDVISRRYSKTGLVARAQQEPWAFEPGTDFLYSNTGYVVVAMMLEEATGVPYQRLARLRVLRPAGMRDSRVATSRGLVPPRLKEYARVAGEVFDLRRAHPSMFSAAGALVSTTHDLGLFHRALARGHLLRRATLGRMRSVVNPVPGGTPYGLGSFRLPSPCEGGPSSLHGHDGALWGTLTWSFSLGRSRQVTVAMTGRSYNIDRFARQNALLVRFLLTAFAGTCRDARDRFSAPAPPRLDSRIAPDLAGR